MAASPLLLGHRGARVLRSCPENTFAAFDAALARGCDGFEFDVRLTADDEAVVVHDPQYRGKVVAKNSAGKLKSLPRLQQVLKRYGSRCFLDIELKVSRLESHLLTALRELPEIRSYVVSSFLPDVIVELRTRRSGIPLGIICETLSQLKRAENLPVEFLILKQTLVDQELVDKCHDEGKKILVWTVNKPSSMLTLAQCGVDGLISDDPALLVKTFRELAEAPTKRARTAAAPRRSRITRRAAE